MFPLDRNRLTREWFHSGRAKYEVTGPNANKFRSRWTATGLPVSGSIPVGPSTSWRARRPTTSRARWSWVIRSASRGRWVSGSTSATPRPTSCWIRRRFPVSPPRSSVRVSSRRPTCFPECRSARIWATARASRKSPRSRSTSRALKVAIFGPGFITTPNLFPGVSISADLGNGPGIQEVATFSVDVEGAEGGVAVSNAHGTVTGAAGGVLLRPFARLISSAGDSVTTYGEPWNMN
ncbi:MspA family porin [Mycolicibacterium holsaticum]|uniref:MspA family porin n=1 Tax=Mycolicibacterium holsaticum TaxID=152142 RepID=UPI003555C675